jgi:hypothetical protein
MNPQQEENYEQWISEFGLHLERVGMMMISDAKVLPCSKADLMKAMEWKEQELCDRANLAVKYDLKESLPNIEKYLEAVRSCKVTLWFYTVINPSDQERVDYFNSFGGFKDFEKIPQTEIQEYMALKSKYTRKGELEVELAEMTETPEPRTGFSSLQKWLIVGCVAVAALSFISLGFPAPYNANYLFKRAFYTPTLVCRDTTYSFARNTQGACSGHGGIKARYAKLAPAQEPEDSGDDEEKP